MFFTLFGIIAGKIGIFIDVLLGLHVAAVVSS
jgi:hypothetical protein